MISYKPFWQTCQNKGITTYALRKLGVSPNTLQKLRTDGTVTTATIDKLCDILKCDISDIIRR